MKKHIVLILLMILCLSFIVSSRAVASEIAQAFELKAKYTYIRSYPNGGGVFIVYIEPKCEFDGKVFLNLVAPDRLNARLKAQVLDQGLPLTEITVEPSSDIRPGTKYIGLVAVHVKGLYVQTVQRMQLQVEVFEWDACDNPSLNEKRDLFIKWLEQEHQEFGLFLNQDYRYYSTYPEILIVEHGTYLNLEWEIRVCDHVMIPPYDWSMLWIRKRGALKPLFAAKRETDNILENVEEGLFTLNKRYIIASQYSAALSQIFEEQILSNRKLTDILHEKIDFGVLNSTVEYLELMFNNELDEKDIEELNPLSQVEFRSGESDNKYLTFNFRRITNKNRITALFATVTDITEQINLAQRLEKSEAQSKRQMEWLLNIMHVEPELIREFIESVEGEITHFRQILSTVIKDDNANNWVDHLYRSVHLIKGNASLLDLSYFAHRAHDCEENLQLLRNKESITHADTGKLTRFIDEMQQSIDEMRGLIEKISQIHHHFRPKRTYETEKLIRSIGNFIRNLSQDLNKKVNFDYAGFNGKALPHNYKLLVKDVLIQLVRNALFHGIEKESERRRMKKDPTGIIELKVHKRNSCLELIFRDDGRGLQIDKLRKSAEKLKLWNKTEIENLQDDQIAQLIFEPGVTTAEHCELSAGRGVGMDLVREKIEKHKGNIRVDSVAGKFCEFIISLPLNMNEEPLK